MSLKTNVTVPLGSGGMHRVLRPRGKLGVVNRLAGETSPYLLQHAANPVDWYPWGDAALTRAREEDKPILLSIGYAACHWCHVMEHESFENPATAAVMNEHYVSVKVDREERPDLDAVYMEAVVAMSGHGGWPMTVFLTSTGEPFYGGTYYPPEPRHGLPSFRQVLEAIAEAWRERRDDVARSAEQLVEAVRQSSSLRPSLEPLTDELLSNAARAAGAVFEPAFGGWGRAPKFPNAPMLEFLLRRGDQTSLAMVVKTLDEMAAGGMYDLLGGGFHRYSVDDRWLVPHFEKMLYDNALLAPAYLHAWLVTGDDRYRAIAEATVEYLLRELLLPEGGFASAQDADTDGVEGLTFTWTEDEGAPAGVLEPFEHGRSIIRGTLDEDLRARLFELREQRPKPLRDDKAIASWNGLALAAIAEAGRRLERPEWVDAATRLGEFLLGPLSDDQGRLLRSYRDGRTSGAGYLDDYANVAHGFLELHIASGEGRWLHRGEQARTTRDRALRRRRARRLLSLARRRRAPRRPDEGARRPPAPFRQLDARARADPALAHLRRRRARAPRSLRASPGPACARTGPDLLRVGVVRARPPAQYAAGARDRRRSRLRRRPRSPPVVAAEHRRRGRPGRGCTLARRENACQRGARRLPLRTFHVPGSGDGSCAAVNPIRSVLTSPSRTLSKFTRRSNLAIQRAFSKPRGELYA